MMNSHLNDLLERHSKRILSPGEERELMVLIGLPENRSQVEAWIDGVISAGGEHMDLPDQGKSLLQAVFSAAPAAPLPIRKKSIVFQSWWRVAAAAVLIFFMGSGIYMLIKRGSFHPDNSIPLSRTDVPAPVGAKTILTLGSGKQIILDSIKTGLLASEGTSDITKIDSNNLVYNSGSAASEIVYNTLTTAIGGQTSVVLPDGTKVWLNASSSLYFPTSFTGRERRVDMTGEAYFEVAHDTQLPFRVFINGFEVRVLGTHFNVNGYANEESAKITLLEGSVQLSSGKNNVLLKPNEQGQVNSSGDLRVIKDVDPEGVIAWKNGLFQFKRVPLESIMRQVERWYGVEVVYDHNISDVFVGTVPRSMPLSKLLDLLQQTGMVHFRIEGRKVFVTS